MNFNLVNKPNEYKSWDKISHYTKFIAEPKYDGVRMLAEKKDGKLTIHRGMDNTKNYQFPEVIPQLANMPDNTIFDGELCIMDKTNPLRADFSKMQKRVNLKDSIKIKHLAESTPATFMAFDCLKYKGQDMTQFPLLKRKSVLQDFPHTIEYVPEELLHMIEKNNMEGIVVKDPNGTYNSEWIKFKNYIETDYKIIGVNSLDHNISSLELAKIEEESGRTTEIPMGSVNWQFYEPEFQTNEIKQKLIGLMVTVRHMTTSQGKVRFPSLQNKDKILRVLAQ
jgi:ATP-dependent DNA ligase